MSNRLTIDPIGITVTAFGAVGDGSTNDAAAIQAAINFLNAFGAKGGVVRFPVPSASYKLGTTSLTIYQNIRLLGDCENYQGATTRGVILTYSGTGNAIFGQDLLNTGIEHITIDCTGATGTSVNGIYFNGAWNSHIDYVTVKGMTASKGFSILIDTNAGAWGAEQNILNLVTCADGIIRFSGTNSSDNVTTTTCFTCFALAWQINNSGICLVNCVVQGWSSGAGIAYTGAGGNNTLIHLDVEGSGPTGISIGGSVSVREFDTDWSGFTGTTRVSGNMASLRSYGGPINFIQPGLAANTPTEYGVVSDANTDYVSDWLTATNVSGGNQTGYRFWKRNQLGTQVIDHDWLEHGFVKKSITTNAMSAFTVLTIPVPSADGLRISVHAHGTQAGDIPFSNSRNANVINNAGTLTIVADTQLTAGDTGAISFAASGASILVQWTPTTNNSSTANFNIEIRGPWTTYS